LKNPSQKIGVVEWLKVKALSSSPTTEKKKKKKD
jgi:ribosomal protein S21